MIDKFQTFQGLSLLFSKTIQCPEFKVAQLGSSFVRLTFA